MIACTCVASWGSAGPIAPPAGPVAPTHKTLTDVEPRTALSVANTPGNAQFVYIIDQPGSYYLADNLIGVPGKRGIWVLAKDVTLDLNGFTIDGTNGAGDGIQGDADSDRTVIKNGQHFVRENKFRHADAAC